MLCLASCKKYVAIKFTTGEHTIVLKSWLLPSLNDKIKCKWPLDGIVDEATLQRLKNGPVPCKYYLVQLLAHASKFDMYLTSCYKM